MAGNARVASDMLAIAADLARQDVKVTTAVGWATRGRSWATFDPRYVGLHHTAATVDVDRILIDGRSDVPGPLCNWALHKDGSVMLVASGLANHFGVASISSAQAYGIEATGPTPLTSYGRQAFPNYDAYVQLVTAICRHHGWGTDRIKAHKEVALPAGRKVNPAFDVTAFRVDVARALSQEQEDDLPYTESELRAMMQAELEEFRSRRPKNLSSDPDNKPWTLGESHGAYVTTGLPHIQNMVKELVDQVRRLEAKIDALGGSA